MHSPQTRIFAYIHVVYERIAVVKPGYYDGIEYRFLCRFRQKTADMITKAEEECACTDGLSMNTIGARR